MTRWEMFRAGYKLRHVARGYERTERAWLRERLVLAGSGDRP